jgi:hypothetical protein
MEMNEEISRSAKQTIDFHLTGRFPDVRRTCEDLWLLSN